MSRRGRMDAVLAAGLLGLQQPGSAAPAFALALVTYTREPWHQPSDRELEAALKIAVSFRLSADLAIFLPAEPGRFASRIRKDAYRSVVISLKQLDALPSEERTAAIAEVRTLLGSA